MRPAALRTGDAVRIRGERWRVAAAASFDEVSIVSVDGCDATNQGTKAHFLVPFERIEAVASRSAAPRVVTHPRWRRAARAMLALAVPRWASLRAAARARLTILPFQLEPAIAVTRGDTCRVLIADEVGLGKTIQAGLIVAETLARTPDARALIVSPAGLREQWRAELHSRFELDANVLDAEGVARCAAQLAPGVNPWSIHPLAITSIDYVKRPEVMRSLETLTWDVLVFDEAHALAGRSDRAAAAAVLARRARSLILLTATPHPGDDEAYARLLALGDLDAGFPLAVFRRTRFDVGLPHGRRTTRLRVRPTDAEAAMHRALDGYIQRLHADRDASPAGATLLAPLLTRRACSSACSLARSLERRMALLRDAPAASDDQLAFPFADPDTDEEPGSELGVAGLRDRMEETRCLEELATLARRASAFESKIGALVRAIRRSREPVLVFTEYRDTLQHVAAALDRFAPLQLHGGLTSRERLDVLRRFTSGDAAVLLATDAASEGLNLQYRCRLVINLELPWTPLRLEQRFGRVDRLGQRRRVHAVQLVARHTPEESIALRLDERRARVEAALGGPADAGAALRADAEAEAARLVSARSLATGTQPPTDRPLLTMVTGRRDDRGSIWAFRLSCADVAGQVVFETITGLRDERIDSAVDGRIEQIAARHHEAVVAATSASLTAWLDLAVRREDAIATRLRDTHARLSATLLQPGLFDRRAERAAAAQASRVEEALQKSRARETLLARARQLHAADRELLFGVTFRP
ncbi:MAG TPA: DEAD/DEAH box helicase [Vicinamibacterales bacterium]|nr:DEAD/DEAH box helicase [Vicinamibacterales bacterium]